MIRESEIKEKAREYGVPVSTIERDYAQNYLLKYLGHLDIALKGGTGIKKVYVKNYRFSEDLDFTLMHKIRTIKAEIRKAVKNAGEGGVNFLNDVRFTNTESGIRAVTYFSIIRRCSGTNMSIKIDITSTEREPILLPVRKKPVFHNYSDKLSILINTYSLEEIIAEKLRALFQRRRPRDLYDVWYFRSYLSKPEVRKTFERKCLLANIKPSFSYLELYKETFLRSWNNSLRNQFKIIPDFEKVYKELSEKLKEIV